MTSLSERLAQRDPLRWLRYGRTLLSILAIVLGLMAIVTFVAHNWTYLATTAKLGVIFALLVICAAMWIWRKFEGVTAVGFGIAAQVLIGVWLAAAGQLYQAPGGVQTLLFNWALLGLPFAIASRNEAHWAVWSGILLAGFASPMSDWMTTFFNPRTDLHWQWLLGAIILSLGYLGALALKVSNWLQVWFAFGLCALIVLSFAVFLFDSDGAVDFLMCLLILSALGVLSFTTFSRRVALAAVSLLCATGLLLFTMILIRFGVESGLGSVSISGYFLLIFAGATFALIQLFGFLIRAYRGVSPKEKEPDNHQEGRPWYMDVLIAIGGVASAISGTVFLGTFLAMIIASSRAEDVALTMTGLVIFSGALVWRLRAVSLFLKYAAGTLLIIGGLATVVGVALTFGDRINKDDAVQIAALVGLGLSSFVIYLIPERFLQILMALASATGVVTIIVANREIMTIPPSALSFAALGSLAVIWLSRARPRLSASALLMVSAIFTVAFIDTTYFGSGDYQFEFPRHIAAIWQALIGLGLLGSMKLTVLPSLPRWPVLIAIIAAAALMPLGGVPVVMLLLIGMAIGSMSLATIGSLALGGWLLWSYYDTDLTLMELSLAFAIGAIVCFGLRWGSLKWSPEGDLA